METKGVARRRALLTDRERELIADEDAGSQRYVAVSRVRTKINDELPDDLRLLEEHHSDLLDELREVVCEDVEQEAIAAAGSSDAERPAESAATPSEPEPAPEPEPDDTAGEGDQPPGVLDGETRLMLRDRLAGSGAVLERRVDAVEAMYARLRELGEAEKADLLDVVDVDATGYAHADSVWSNVVKGKDTLAALPGVEKPASGMSTWRYDPEAADE